MPGPTAEPLSPELILVSPPEEAALAREQLADPPQTLRNGPAPAELPETPSGDPVENRWNEFLADVRSRQVESVAASRPRPQAPIRRPRGRQRILVAAGALIAVAAVVGLAWARDRGQQEPGSSAASMPVPSHAGATPHKAATHASTTPAPAVTTAPKATRSPTPKSSKRQPPPKHTAGFVPTRVWSWAAASSARAYVVRFLRDGHKVFKTRTVSPRLELPSSFSFAPGRYRWTVTAIPRNGKGHVIVNSSFTVAPNG